MAKGAWKPLSSRKKRAGTQTKTAVRKTSQGAGLTALPPEDCCFQPLTVSEKTRFAKFWSQQLPGTALFPVVNKQPVSYLAWSDFLRSPGLHGSDADWKRATGYAIAPTSNSAVHIIDVDQNSFLTPLFEAIPELIETLWIQRGERFHFYVHTGLPLQQAIVSLRDKRGAEVASIRGVGAYAVGPWSDHPSSGDIYKSTDPRYTPPIRLTAEQTKRLYELFAHTPDQPRLTNAPWGPSRETKDDIAAELKGLGFRATGNKGWIKGRCIFANEHKDGCDRRPSATFHPEAGIYNCFTCGRHGLREVANRLNLNFETKLHSGKPAFAGQLLIGEGGLVVEMNIASELLRRRKAAALRLTMILWQDSHHKEGKSTYTHQQILEAAGAFGLDEYQTKYAITECIELGALRRTKRGKYLRTGIEKLKTELGLNPKDKARAELPGPVARSIKGFTNRLIRAFYEFLPQGLSSRQLAIAMGISRSRLYEAEQALGTKREKQLRFLGEREPKDGFTFAVCRDPDGRPRWTCTSDEISKRLPNARQGDRLEFYQQTPSRRTHPNYYVSRK